MILSDDKETITKDYIKGMSLRQIHRKYGIPWTRVQRIVSKAGVMRNLSQAALLSHSGQQKWRKLVRVPLSNRRGDSTTRLVSIPSSELKKIGVNIDAKLLGCWYTEKGKLILEIKESE